MVKELIGKGASINAKDNVGATLARTSAHAAIPSRFGHSATLLTRLALLGNHLVCQFL